MSALRIATWGAAPIALLAAAPAMAQGQTTYELPAEAAAGASYTPSASSQLPAAPVNALPSRMAQRDAQLRQTYVPASTAATVATAHHGASTVPAPTVHTYPAPMHHAAPHQGMPHHGVPVHQMPTHQGPVYYPAPPQGHVAAPQHFDREAWLDECRADLGDGKRKGGLFGGVLGAIAGGVIGNRVDDDGNRLAGTLIGAGVGGIAGAVIGQAIGGASDRRERDECERYLDGYGYGYPAQGYGQGYGYGYPAYGQAYTYTYVPTWVEVPQRAVVREYVTEEWVDEPTTETVYETEVIERPVYTPAPQPVMIKQKPVKIKEKYIKNQ